MATPKTIRLRETSAPDDAQGQKLRVLVLGLDDLAGLARAHEAKARVWDVEATSRREATALLERSLREAPDKKKDRSGFLAWEEAREAVTAIPAPPAAVAAKDEEVLGG